MVFLNGNKIIAQDDETNRILFYYGIDGLAGFSINGVEYTYKKNNQNDIIGIYDADGNQIVKYVYDAWGNHKTFVLYDSKFVDISLENDYNDDNYKGKVEIAELNPFRYRSYYLDEETGLYYLNSRYYDAELGRFINADNVKNLNKLAFNGLNLYSYCLNNPIMFMDTSGALPFSISTLLRILSTKQNKNRKNSINLEVEESWSLFEGILKYLTINIEYTATVSVDSPSMFYSYYSYNSNKDVLTKGIGMNLNDSLGISLYASSDISAGVQLQIDQFHFGASIGLDGIGFNFGITIGETTHDININISYTTIAAAAVVASLPIPGSRVVALFILIFDLIL